MKTHKEFMRKSLLCTLISKLLHICWPSSAKKKNPENTSNLPSEDDSLLNSNVTSLLKFGISDH